jgi:hypothetical protein
MAFRHSIYDLGKLLVFVGLIWAGITGQVHFIMIGPGTVDLVFVILFIKFLMVLNGGV